MRLRKQTGAKALIVAATAGLMFFFFGLAKSEPRIAAEERDTGPPSPADTYQRFFAPGTAPPLESETMPVSDAAPVWASVTAGVRIPMTNASSA